MKTLFANLLGVLLSKAIFGLLGLVFVGYLVFAENTGSGVVFIVAGAAAIVLAVFTSMRSKKRANEALWAGLTAQASAFEEMAKSGFGHSAPFSLEKGEEFIAEVPGVSLAEFKSNGSTYQGGNLGVSVPLFGRVRANVGASRGQVVRNPAALTVIDQGSASFTTTRVIFTGVQQTRVFDLDKVVHFEPGPNGLSVNISTANRESTSTLMTNDNAVLAPGILFDIAVEIHNGGKSAGAEKLTAYAELLRNTVADAQRAKR